MSYNHSSSYNRTYERKVVEESPRIRVGSPFQITTSTFQPSSSILGGIGGGGPHNYHFGGTTGSFHSSDESFSATIDLHDFKPEDLSVSVVGSQIVVEGKHPEKEDQLGFIQRHFIRKFNLPKTIPADAVNSNLSAEGRLSITATAPQKKETAGTTTIPIKIVPGTSA